MSVTQLIAELSKYPPDAEVVIDNCEWGEDSPTVYQNENSGKVILV